MEGDQHNFGSSADADFPGFRCALYSDPESRAAASRDFGNVARALPAAVLAPQTNAEVSALMAHAAARGRAVVVRGAAHSQGGQCLSSGGYVVSTERLRAIGEVHRETKTVVVGAGARWHEVLEKTLPLGLAPPVLTDNLNVTVGGTLAVGGVGPASFRRGLQVHHCEAIEVVSNSGEIAWLSRQARRDLFQAVLGGLGRLGVVTRARLKLCSCSPWVHAARVTYEALDLFLADARALLRTDAPSYLAGSAHHRRGKRHFVMLVGMESETPIAGSMQLVLKRLRFQKRLTESESFGAFARRHGRVFDSEAYTAADGVARPWVETILPWCSVPEYVERVCAWFPETPLLLWPLRAQNVRWPSVAIPSAEDLMLVGILAKVEREHLPQMLPRLEAASRLSRTLGGKRYLSGWLDFKMTDWCDHYGQYWSERQRLEHRSTARLPSLP